MVLSPNILIILNILVHFFFFCRNQFCAMLLNIIPKTKYQLKFTKDNGVKKLHWINYKFTLRDVITVNLCIALGIFNLYSKVFSL